jgi:hypothetical protein
MKRIIITESQFPAFQIEKLTARRAAEILSLDGWGDEPTRNVVGINVDRIRGTWDDAYCLAQNWYLVNGKDVTEYKGISLGKIIEIEMWYYWRSILEKVEILRQIIDGTVPDEICLATFDNDVLKQIVRAVFGGDIRVTSVSPPLVQRLAAWRDFDFMRRCLKDQEMDRLVRLLALWWNSTKLFKFKQKQNIGELDVLALLEQPGTYLADTILPVLSFFPNSAVLLMDPRHQNRARQTGREILYFSDTLIGRFREFLRLRRSFVEKWEKYRHLLSSSIRWNGLNLWPVVSERFQRIFRRKLPLVAVEVDGARQLLIERKVKSLLLASDAHHGERLFTLVANQLGIPSLVVQHGATLGDFGYVPLYATQFAAWGEISKQWLIARGVSPERIVITGSPRLDNLADNKKFGLTREDFCSQLSLPPSGLWVLWAMDPITKQENAAILKVLLDVVNRIEWCYLIIRPHPGSPQTAWISRFVNSQKHVVISSPEYPLYEILKAVDAVIIQDSTVGLEAMALDKPVIVLYPKGKPIGELYIQSGAVNVVTCVDELQHTLEHLYQNRALTVTDSMSFARYNFVRSFFFEIDGQSVRRVAEAIAALLVKLSEERYGNE